MKDDESIRKIILTELIKENNNIKLEETDPLIESGIIDSLGIMKLITFLEETFEITIDFDDLSPENLETVNAISMMVQKKLVMVK